MYIEIHNYEDIEQVALYYKLNNAFSIDNDSGKTEKIKGIYAIYNNDICLYVGQSKNIASRLATHIKGKYKIATEIYFWNVENIGFSDFDSRSTDSKSSILDNIEKYVMSKLTPIENISIDMTISIPEDNAPDICFESNACMTLSFQKHGGCMTITDSYSSNYENLATSIDYMDYSKQISKKTYALIRDIIGDNEIKYFGQKGVKNEH